MTTGRNVRVLGAVVSAVLLLPIVLVASGSSTQGRPTRQSSMRRPSTGDGGGTAVVGRSVDAVLDVAAPAPVLSRTVARTHSAAPKRPTNDASHASLPATAASTCSASTSSATSNSTPAAASCCSRSSPNAKNDPPSRSRRTCRSANGPKSSPTPASSPPSSTASPSTPTSSRPAPTATGCAPPRPGSGARPPERRSPRRHHPSAIAIGASRAAQQALFETDRSNGEVGPNQVSTLGPTPVDKLHACGSMRDRRLDRTSS